MNFAPETLIPAFLQQHQARFSALSDAIWATPETRFCETRSSARLADTLEQAGFAVTRGVGGMATAFIASVGSGSPILAILGEFDTLAGMSQQAGGAEPLAHKG